MASDIRLGDVIAAVDVTTDQIPRNSIVLFGFPWDEGKCPMCQEFPSLTILTGVRRNGGRIGAREGPAAFRKYTRRLCASSARQKVRLDKGFILDGGDAKGNTLEDAHEDLYQKVSRVVANCTAFVVGGGNDQSYPNVRGLLSRALQDQKLVYCANANFS